MEAACRVCMSNCVTLVELFNPKPRQLEELSLVEMLKECVGCDIHQDDPLPKQICLTCLIETKNAFRLKRKCEESQRNFWKMLGKVSLLKLEPSETLEEEQLTQSKKETGTFTSNDLKKFRVQGFSAKTLMSDPLSSTVQGHTQFHDSKPYKCKDCSKAFSREMDFEEHRLGCNRVERFFKCSKCTKCFSSAANFQLHLRIHANERSLVCPNCSRGFQQLPQLEKHLRTHSTYKCSHCPKTFVRKQDANYHILLHTDERPHKCPQCSKAFKKKQHVEYHLLTHMGQQP